MTAVMMPTCHVCNERRVVCRDCGACLDCCICASEEFCEHCRLLVDLCECGGAKGVAA